MPDKLTSCVLLADRHHGLAEGVRGLLSTAFGTVVMVADQASLHEGAVRLRPDLAVVDLSLARDSGLGWLRELHGRCPDLKIIVLSVHDEPSVGQAAMAAGADAVVLKRAIATDLLLAVDLVLGGQSEDVTADAVGPTGSSEKDSKRHRSRRRASTRRSPKKLKVGGG